MDDASIWMSTQGQEIQDYEVPPCPVIEEPEAIEEPESVTRADVAQQNNIMQLNKPISTTIVAVMDVVLPLVAFFLLKSDKEDLKLEDSEAETLVNAWSLYLGDKNVSMSPGMALIVSIATIYGSKVIIAMHNKKEKEELEFLKQQNSALKQQLEQQEKEHGSKQTSA